MVPKMLKHILILSAVFFSFMPLLAGTRQFSPLKPGEVPPANPFRGLYAWSGTLGQGTLVEDVPTRDSYARFFWSDLEPAQGQYDFKAVEDCAEAARKYGRTFSFRVRCFAVGRAGGVPGWLKEKMPRGYDSGKDYIPDWNDPDFCQGVTNLLAALGKKYNRDPRIAFVDVGIYGNWGEWHMSGFDYPLPSGALPIRPEVARAIIDLHVEHFSQKWLFFRTVSAHTAYAMSYPQMGMRSDALGMVPSFEHDMKENGAVLANRWKTTPFIVETGGDHPEMKLELMPEHVRTGRVAMVGNGNLTGNTDPAKQPAGPGLLREAGLAAGYRFQLLSVQTPDRVQGSLSIKSLWKNAGNTPAYDPWVVTWQLWQGEKMIHHWASALEPSAFLPSDQEKILEEILRLPSGLAQGRYEIKLKVIDGAGIRAPLRLDIKETPDASEAYPVGSFDLAGPASTEGLAGRTPDQGFVRDPLPVQLARLPRGPFTTLREPVRLADVETSIPASADTYVRGGRLSAKNYSKDRYLTLRNSSGEYDRQAFLKFDLHSLAGKTFSKAVLRLFPVGQVPKNPSKQLTVDVGLTTAAWEESSLTYADKPERGMPVKNEIPVTISEMVEIDVTAQVNDARSKDGMLSFSLGTQCGEEIRFASRDNAAKAPEVVPQIVFFP